jgi:hypothetical protein
MASELLRAMTGLAAAAKPPASSGLLPSAASSARPCDTVRVAGLGGSLAASLSEEKSRGPPSPLSDGSQADLGCDTHHTWHQTLGTGHSRMVSPHFLLC